MGLDRVDTINIVDKAVTSEKLDTNINIVGDLTFSGAGAGLLFGAQCLHEGAVNMDFSTAGQGVYIQVTGFVDGPLNGVTITDDKFFVTKTGFYKVSWDISGDSAGTGKDYETDLFVNGVEQACASARRGFGAIGSLGVLAASGVFEVTDIAHAIELRMKEVGAAGGTDMDIFHMNFNIVQVGGN